MPIQFIPSGILEKINFDRRLEGTRSLGAAEPDGTMFRSPWLQGTAVSKSITALEGVRSLGATEPGGENVPPSRLRGTATLQVNDGNQSFG
jgi:hypothetical protein